MKYVLFVCNHNAGRSQIAQAFFEALAPAALRAESAGTDPAAQIWPAVVEVMAEVGLDISDRTPKKLTREMQLNADLAVTMGCGDACPYVRDRLGYPRSGGRAARAGARGARHGPRARPHAARRAFG